MEVRNYMDISSRCVNTGIQVHVKLWWKSENFWVLYLDA